MPVRTLVLIAAIVVWLGLMLVATGVDGVTALWTNLLFVLGLIVLTALTRTVSLRTVGWLGLMGGLMMALMLIPAAAISVVLDDSALRGVVVPLLEEALKLLPVLYLLWRWRHGSAWSLGASDLLVMGAAAGAGFGLVEDAYIRHRAGWPDQLDWLPVTEIIGDHLIVGHAVWTTIAAGLLGMAVLMRSRRALATLLAVAGFAWAVLDHVANNYAVAANDALADLLVLLTVNGWLSLWLFVGVVVLAIGADLFVLSRVSPLLPRSSATPPSDTPSRLAWRWRMQRRRRALSYAVFQYAAAAPESEAAPKEAAIAIGSEAI